MRNSRIDWAGRLAAIGLSFSVAADRSFSADVPTAQPPGIALVQADALVREALLAETDGNLKLRGEKLQQAVITAPDSAAAHWQLGLLRLGDAWQTIEDAAQAAAHAGKVAEYRQRREQIQPTAEDHLILARWCRTAGLKVQERGNLLLALQLDRNSKEAISKLGLAHYHGELVTPDQIEEYKSRLREYTANIKLWDARLASLKVQYEKQPSLRDSVLSIVRNLDAEAAIPSIERVFGTAKTELALAAVQALTANKNQKATETLLRFAVFSTDTEIQRAATSALRCRPAESYVPLLLASLKLPIQTQFDATTIEGNAFLTRWVVYQEGPFSNDVAINYTRVAVTSQKLSPSKLPSLAKSEETIYQHRSESRLQRVNDLNVVRNERVASVLASITEEPYSPEPRKWWNWWFDKNEYYQPPDKPTNQETNYYSGTIRVSCFVRGTLVWTMTGPMPIEKIKTGEAVLSQDPQTGELAYKPVLATTYRPPSPTVEIHVGNTVVRGTRGHPFWVAGQGWQMAKQLHTGQCLHAAAAPQVIDAVTQAEDAECFNLVAADFHNYFVGDARVLVHDNTLRGPTLNRVPGLTE